VQVTQKFFWVPDRPRF